MNCSSLPSSSKLIAVPAVASAAVKANFIVLLKELNLIDKDSIAKEFNSLSQNLKDTVKQKIDRVREWNVTGDIIDHKTYLKKLQ